MITGKAGVGKSTYADMMLEEKYSKDIAFADYLKFMARGLGWNGVKDLKGRTFLQELGDVVNNYDRTFWTNYVIRTMQLPETRWVEHWIITDLRYDIEFELVKEAFPDIEVEVIELVRNFDSILTDEQKQHPSENGISLAIVTKQINLDEVDL